MNWRQRSVWVSTKLLQNMTHISMRLYRVRQGSAHGVHVESRGAVAAGGRDGVGVCMLCSMLPVLLVVQSAFCAMQCAGGVRGRRRATVTLASRNAHSPPPCALGGRRAPSPCSVPAALRARGNWGSPCCPLINISILISTHNRSHRNQTSKSRRFSGFNTTQRGAGCCRGL